MRSEKSIKYESPLLNGILTSPILKLHPLAKNTESNILISLSLDLSEMPRPDVMLSVCKCILPPGFKYLILFYTIRCQKVLLNEING